MSEKRMILAVDGGGSRCRVVLVRGAERFTAETGPANVSTDMDGAIRQIDHGLRIVAEQGELEIAHLRVVPAYLGLAGVVSTKIADDVAARLFLSTVRVEDDRRAAVRGALGSADGALLHCGTGSFVAVQQGGVMTLAGGWGSVLGDEASAQWVGRRALSVTLDVVDTITDASPMTQAVLARFGRPDAIVRFAASADASRFGAIAPLVTQFAQERDANAVSILRAGAEYLGRTLRAMGWRATMPVAMTGGIAECYTPYLEPDIAQAFVSARNMPVEGAVSLAQEFAQTLSGHK